MCARCNEGARRGRGNDGAHTHPPLPATFTARAMWATIPSVAMLSSSIAPLELYTSVEQSNATSEKSAMSGASDAAEPPSPSASRNSTRVPGGAPCASDTGATGGSRSQMPRVQPATVWPTAKPLPGATAPATAFASSDFPQRRGPTNATMDNGHASASTTASVSSKTCHLFDPASNDASCSALTAVWPCSVISAQ